MVPTTYIINILLKFEQFIFPGAISVSSGLVVWKWLQQANVEVTNVWMWATMPAMRILWFVVSITTLFKDQAHHPKHELFIGGVPGIFRWGAEACYFCLLSPLSKFYSSVNLWFHKCLLVCSNVKIEWGLICHAQPLHCQQNTILIHLK